MNAPPDPCLNCPLPDCDESNPRCALRRASAAYRRLKKQRRLDEASANVRSGYNEWFRIWKLEHEAQLNEAVLEAAVCR